MEANFRQSWNDFFGLLTSLLLKWEEETLFDTMVDGLYSQLHNCTTTLQYLLLTMEVLLHDDEDNEPDNDFELDEDILSVVNKLQHLDSILRYKVLPEIECRKECSMSVAEVPLPRQNQPMQQRTGRRGRPSFVLDSEQVVQLRCMGFHWEQIANIVGVSVRTLHRKRKEADINDARQFSAISDEELCSQLAEIKLEFPDVGERMALGIFRSKGMIIPRRRIREAFHLIDPINTSMRWHTRIKRRTYSVPGPMSLWHIGEFPN